MALLLDTTRRRAVIWTGVDLDIEIMLGWVGLVFSLMMGAYGKEDVGVCWTRNQVSFDESKEDYGMVEQQWIEVYGSALSVKANDPRLKTRAAARRPPNFRRVFSRSTYV